MREFFGIYKTHVRRGVLSPMFMICTALCTALMLFCVRGRFAVSAGNHGLNYFLDSVRGSSSDYFMMMIMCFPAVMLFYEDWTSGSFKFIVERSGRRKYAFSVILAAGTTAAALTVISYLIFSGVMLTKHPLIPDIDAETLRQTTIGFPNSGLLYTGHEVLCYVLYILSQGARSAFYAAVAVLQSMFITNKHLTAISPVLLYICYFTFNLYYILPELLNPYVLFWNGFRLYVIFTGTIEGSLFSPIAAVYPFIYCAVILVLIALAAARVLRVKMNRSI